ncbi:MAG: YbaY family lipoprotein [Hyphomonas sp.]
MRLALVLAGAGSLALAACTPAPETPAPASASQPPVEAEAAQAEAPGAKVRGEATWSGLDAPETARLIIEVRDVTRTADVNDLVLKEEFAVAGGSPAAFSASIPAYDLIPEGNLVLRARLQDGYAILLASDGDIDIADTGETAGLQVPLFNPEDLARGRAGQMITPAGASYTCGGETLIIAVEAGAAYVTFGDGTSVRLDKLATGAGAATQFSNGRFVVEQGADEYGAPVLKFGRGRATPLPCTAG